MPQYTSDGGDWKLIQTVPEPKKEAPVKQPEVPLPTVKEAIVDPVNIKPVIVPRKPVIVPKKRGRPAKSN